MNPWEFSPESDTQKSYKGFCIYRDLGTNRSLPMAYALYQGRSEGGKRAAGYFERWCRDGNWQVRAAAWDLYQESFEREVRAESDRVAYLLQLSEFRELQISIGRGAVLTLQKIRLKVHDFLESMEPLENLDDCEQLCRIAKSLDGGAEMWAVGLSISELLEQAKNEST